MIRIDLYLDISPKDIHADFEFLVRLDDHLKDKILGDLHMNVVNCVAKLSDIDLGLYLIIIDSNGVLYTHEMDEKVLNNILYKFDIYTNMISNIYQNEYLKSLISAHDIEVDAMNFKCDDSYNNLSRIVRIIDMYEGKDLLKLEFSKNIVIDLSIVSGIRLRIYYIYLPSIMGYRIIMYSKLSNDLLSGNILELAKYLLSKIIKFNNIRSWL